MFSEKEIRKITKLFQDINLKIVFHTQHVTENILSPKPLVQVSTAKLWFYLIKFLGSRLLYIR